MHTYRGRETNEGTRGTVCVDVLATRVRVLANQANILIRGVWVAVKYIPSRGGGQVGNTSLCASLHPPRVGVVLRTVSVPLLHSE